jgi:hypothetical protein
MVFQADRSRKAGMVELHNLLKKQLQRFSVEPTQLSVNESKLLQAINEAYWAFRD